MSNTHVQLRRNTPKTTDTIKGKLADLSASSASFKDGEMALGRYYETENNIPTEHSFLAVKQQDSDNFDSFESSSIRKNIEGQSGTSYSPVSENEILSAATNMTDADKKLADAIIEVSKKSANVEDGRYIMLSADTATTKDSINFTLPIWSGTTGTDDNEITYTGTDGLSFNSSDNLALGKNSVAQGGYSEIIDGIPVLGNGRPTTAIGNSSHAEGEITKAFGQASHAEGHATTAVGNYSHAEGGGYYDADSKTYSYNPIAYGVSINRPPSELLGNLAYGDSSHAEGLGNTANGDSSHAEGLGNTANGVSSHVEGLKTISNGNFSHAEGINTTAQGESSHAEGCRTIANGYASHAEGAFTVSSGESSHAEGHYTSAIGDYSHSEGDGTIAANEYETVVGQYNLTGDTNSLFTVGNGTEDSKRSNVFSVGKDGLINVCAYTDSDKTASTYTSLQNKLVEINNVSGDLGNFKDNYFNEIDIVSGTSNVTIGKEPFYDDGHKLSGMRFTISATQTAQGKVEYAENAGHAASADYATEAGHAALSTEAGHVTNSLFVSANNITYEYNGSAKTEINLDDVYINKKNSLDTVKIVAGDGISAQSSVTLNNATNLSSVTYTIINTKAGETPTTPKELKLYYIDSAGIYSSAAYDTLSAVTVDMASAVSATIVGAGLSANGTYKPSAKPIISAKEVTSLALADDALATELANFETSANSSIDNAYKQIVLRTGTSNVQIESAYSADSKTQYWTISASTGGTVEHAVNADSAISASNADTVDLWHISGDSSIDDDTANYLMSASATGVSGVALMVKKDKVIVGRALSADSLNGFVFMNNSVTESPEYIPSFNTNSSPAIGHFYDLRKLGSGISGYYEDIIVSGGNGIKVTPSSSSTITNGISSITYTIENTASTSLSALTLEYIDESGNEKSIVYNGITPYTANISSFTYQLSGAISGVSSKVQNIISSIPLSSDGKYDSSITKDAHYISSSTGVLNSSIILDTKLDELSGTVSAGINGNYLKTVVSGGTNISAITGDVVSGDNGISSITYTVEVTGSVKNAEQADKVANSLIISSITESGQTVSASYDGSSATTIDLTKYETISDVGTLIGGAGLNTNGTYHKDNKTGNTILSGASSLDDADLKLSETITALNQSVSGNYFITKVAAGTNVDIVKGGITTDDNGVSSQTYTVSVTGGGTGSTNYADNAGNADTVDHWHFSGDTDAINPSYIFASNDHGSAGTMNMYSISNFVKPSDLDSLITSGFDKSKLSDYKENTTGSTESELKITSADTIADAFAKMQKQILDLELIIARALTDQPQKY